MLSSKKNILLLVLAIFIKSWQKTSILRSALNLGNCRFYPSCSEYFLQAVEKHGFLKGFLMFLKRLSICQPSYSCEVDEVRN